MSWQSLLYVGMGGFLGANARYILSSWLTPALSDRLGWSLPYGTAFVNITGSLLLALFVVWASRRADLAQGVTLLIGTGFFGAYTTFSTYANESVTLFSEAGWRTGIGYMLLTNALCVLGVVLGIALANRIWTT